MKKFNEIFNEMKMERDDWENNIIKYLDDQDKNTDEFYEKIFNQLADIYKEIDNDDLAKEELKKVVKSKKTVEVIHEEICKINSLFNDLRILRKLEKTEPKMLYYVYESIFNNYILHIDITTLEYLSNLFTNVKYDENEILSCARALDFISEMYVRNFFSQKMMIDEFSQQSGIDKENSSAFIELICKNEMTIKINYLIKSFEDKKLNI